MRRRSVRLDLLLLLAATTVAACGGGDGGNTIPVPPGSGGAGGSATGGKGGSGGTASGGSSGSGGSAVAGSGGSTPGAGGGGGSLPDAPVTDAGTTEASVGSPDTGSATDAPAATTGWMGYTGIADLSQVKRSPGCGMPAGQPLGSFQRFEIAVPNDQNKGDGRRVYYVELPANYDPSKAYKVVVGSTGCVPNANNSGTSFRKFQSAAGPEGIIQIGLEIENGAHQIAGGYNCYDDKNTRSIEYPFLEKVLETVSSKYCYDQHKVFLQGHSSGGWLSNQMGCVYGSTLLRAVAPHGGGLARGEGVAPPCKENPTPGIWFHPTGDSEGKAETRDHINRALKLNKCGEGTWETAPKRPFTMGGAVDCDYYTGCPAAFPVVYCHPNGGHDQVAWFVGASWAFFSSLP